VFWALMVVVTIKYVCFVRRADNDGEGGIIAVLGLASSAEVDEGRRRRLVLIGLAGAALFYGDGMITPAISVLSAVEGLEVATPLLKPYVIPLTVVVLIGLFAMQSRGSARIGMLFGPVMSVWLRAPDQLAAGRHRHRAGAELPLLRRAGGGIRHRRFRHDAGHDVAAGRGRASPVGLGNSDERRRDRHVSCRGSRVLLGELGQDQTRQKLGAGVWQWLEWGNRGYFAVGEISAGVDDTGP
jgi:hypothetical protein